MRRVVITGAAGLVGGVLREQLRGRHRMVLLDRVPVLDADDDEAVVVCDIRDGDRLLEAMDGADSVVHLAGEPTETSWERILEANIDGCFRVAEAARQSGIRRLVFASSNHAIGFYPRSQRIGTDVTVRPDSRYGVSKAFGEALGAFYAMKHAMGVTCLRIGNVNAAPLDRRRLAIMLHPEDLMQLVRIGLEHPDIVFEVLYGMSGNTRAWWDNSRAAALGYRPKHDSETNLAAAEAGQAAAPADPVGDHYQGGTLCSAEYTADFEAMKRREKR